MIEEMEINSKLLTNWCEYLMNRRRRQQYIMCQMHAHIYTNTAPKRAIHLAQNYILKYFFSLSKMENVQTKKFFK